MERCDFASIMQIIRGGFMEGAFPNQMALVTKLFSDFLKEGTDDIFIDASQVNKWFHGTLKPSPSMSSFYAMDQINQDALAVLVVHRINRKPHGRMNQRFNDRPPAGQYNDCRK